MASIGQLRSGRWQVQVRLKGKTASETFLIKAHALEWAREAENQADRGQTPVGRDSKTGTSGVA